VKRARSSLAVKLRRGRLRDLDALIAIEDAVFTTDNLSRRSFRHFLTSRGATLLVAEENGKLAGYVLVLCRPRSKLARLYSIAVAPHIGRRGVGPLLLKAAEDAARRRGRRAMRLEIIPAPSRAMKSPVTACSAGIATIMTTAATRSDSRNCLAWNLAAAGASGTKPRDSIAANQF
jgi:GNAT superfamily N-acetyltransferase